MSKKYIAVIQAGGKGTRMVSMTKDIIPKPMLELNGKPMIQWQIEQIKKYHISNFVIITGYLGEKISEHFGDGLTLGVNISYIREEEPLGSAGALYYLKDLVKDKEIILVFGDVMFEVDWDKAIAFHEKNHALATLLAHPNAHPFDSDLLILDQNSRVLGIDSKDNVRDYWYENCVNSGLYILSGNLIQHMTSPKRMDLEKDVLQKQLASGRIFAYVTPEYIKDAGTLGRFLAVCEEQKKGVWSRRCLKNTQKCIFLDRDGTVNVWKGFIDNAEKIELEKTVEEAIRKINTSEYLVIVVTNQPVVARGMCTIEDVKEMHKKIDTLLGNEGAYINEYVFCPHHPDKGFPEENPIYKVNCNCRKPKTGMVDKMAEKYNIDLSQSWIIGDSSLDIQMGKNAGMGTILVLTGQKGLDGKYEVKADMVCNNLKEAVDCILGEVV